MVLCIVLAAACCKLTSQVESKYVVVQAFEEGPGCYILEAHMGGDCVKATITVSDQESARIGRLSPTPDERETFALGNPHAIARALADRLSVTRDLVSSKLRIWLRQTGEGGQIVARYGTKYGGMVLGRYALVTVYRTPAAYAIHVYLPATVTVKVFRLGALERGLLLGAGNVSTRAAITAAVKSRLTIVPRLRDTLPGIGVVVPPDVPDLVSLDRSLCRCVSRVEATWVHFSLDLAVGSTGDVLVCVYVPSSSLSYRLWVPCGEIRELLESSGADWPPSKPGPIVSALAKCLIGCLHWGRIMHSSDTADEMNSGNRADGSQTRVPQGLVVRWSTVTPCEADVRAAAALPEDGDLGGTVKWPSSSVAAATRAGEGPYVPRLLTRQVAYRRGARAVAHEIDRVGEAIRLVALAREAARAVRVNGPALCVGSRCAAPQPLQTASNSVFLAENAANLAHARFMKVRYVDLCKLGSC